MKILAIDTSALAASAAICENEKIIAQYTRNTSHTHSETMLPMVNEILCASSLTTDDIDLFALSAGPGSFTGVRIGVSIIKGLTFGKNKPIASVSTLEALAYNLSGFKGIVCPVMDARRNQFYTALFKDGERLTPDLIITASELSERLSQYDYPVYFTGDGYHLAKQLIVSDMIKDTPEHLRLQNAVCVAMCARKNYQNNENILDDSSLRPIYLRASQAERERNKRLENEKQ